MVSPQLLRLAASTYNPELKLFLFVGIAHPNEAAEHLTLYQAAFPTYSIVHSLYSDTLIIPFGAVLIAICEGCLALVFATLLQLITILDLSPKTKIAVLSIVSQIPLLVIASNISGKHTMQFEYAFFFFANHLAFTLLLTLGSFVLVQLSALKRVQAMELI